MNEDISSSVYGDEERELLLKLVYLPEFGSRTLRALFAGKSRKAVTDFWNMPEKDMTGHLAAACRMKEEKAKRLAGRVQTARKENLRGMHGPNSRQLRDAGIDFVFFGEAGYPGRLMNIPDYPFVLFYRGKLPADSCRSAAVIGSRRADPYGMKQTQLFTERLAAAGVQIISGLARGIDGCAGRTALSVPGGYACGVLGCGVDICYPPGHRQLYELHAEKGGLVSEYLPGTEPKPSLFPPRNRLISGLADAVLVIEAAAKSGTMITVNTALEQGKDVYAVPGRVGDRFSEGCNELIAQGAGIATDPFRILEALGQNPLRGKSEERNEKTDSGLRDTLVTPENADRVLEEIRAQTGLSGQAAALYAAADENEKRPTDMLFETVDSWGAAAAGSTAERRAALTELVFLGLFAEEEPGYFIKKNQSGRLIENRH